MSVRGGAGDAIDPRGREPEYRQLAAILRRRIYSGQIPAAGVLPSEQQIRDEFGLSRNTARRAIAMLRSDGVVVTVAGRGTYVADPLPGPEDDTPART
jgi:GntR family transcriptional regulator